jgi:hypothetical protein
MPEHSVITDPNIHEPKGVAAASAGQVYVANGSGSGVWTALATPWSVVVKTSDQSVTSSTSYTDCTGLSFAVAANTNYTIVVQMNINTGAGAYKISATAPAAPVSFRAIGSTTSNDATHISSSASSVATSIRYLIVLQNGANSGTFTLRVAQNSSSGTASVFQAGSYLEYRTF